MCNDCAALRIETKQWFSTVITKLEYVEHQNALIIGKLDALNSMDKSIVQSLGAQHLVPGLSMLPQYSTNVGISLLQEGSSSDTLSQPVDAKTPSTRVVETSTPSQPLIQPKVERTETFAERSDDVDCGVSGAICVEPIMSIGSESKNVERNSADYQINEQMHDAPSHVHRATLPDTCPTPNRKTGLKRSYGSGPKRYKCDFCGYQSYIRGDVVKHRRTHTGEKPFACQSCPFRTSNKRNLITHTMIHTGEKPFKCELCDYRTSLKSSLLQHHGIHTGERRFKCEYCDYGCNRRPVLQKHMAKKHMDIASVSGKFSAPPKE